MSASLVGSEMCIRDSKQLQATSRYPSALLKQLPLNASGMPAGPPRCRTRHLREAKKNAGRTDRELLVATVRSYLK
eukprot:69877-Alexandrium_andersonii.AAC.1